VLGHAQHPSYRTLGLTDRQQYSSTICDRTIYQDNILTIDEREPQWKDESRLTYGEGGEALTNDSEGCKRRIFTRCHRPCMMSLVHLYNFFRLWFIHNIYQHFLDSTMALVGTLLFCTDCGSILARCPPSQDLIKCDMCSALNNST